MIRIVPFAISALLSTGPAAAKVDPSARYPAISANHAAAVALVRNGDLIATKTGHRQPAQQGEGHPRYHGSGRHLCYHDQCARRLTGPSFSFRPSCYADQRYPPSSPSSAHVPERRARQDGTYSKMLKSKRMRRRAMLPHGKRYWTRTPQIARQPTLPQTGLERFPSYPILVSRSKETALRHDRGTVRGCGHSRTEFLATYGG